MTENKPTHAAQQAGRMPDMPDAFVTQVRELLASLYDLPHFQELPLVKERAALQQRPLRNVALAVKQEVLELLELLNPGRDFYFRAPEARPYNILLLHYVERHIVQKAADELRISERQAYRELRQAEASLALLLWRRHQERAFTSAVQDSIAPHAQAEAADAIDLDELLASVVDVVRPLAAASSVGIELAGMARPVALMLNLPVARQVLIALLSRAVQAAAAAVTISVIDAGPLLKLAIQTTLRPEAPESAWRPDGIIQPLVKQLGWNVQWEAHGSVSLHLPKPPQQKTILCIDDDASFSELLRRYLTGYPVQVLSALNGQQGIEQALHAAPDLVVLDVMMAGLDGWETLQRMRTHVALQHLPIIVCSVFNDPELARSLGATAMLPKPLAPATFLHALEQVGVL
ncbi:MAG: response regulator [Caldilinea sp.]